MGFDYHRDTDGIVTVTMDMEGQSANTMSAAYEKLMGDTVQKFEAETAFCGVVIASAKKTFFAGGDLHGLMNMGRADGAYVASVNESKGFLRRLETLGVPVAAAINGAALGGGFEICLACSRRIILDSLAAIHAAEGLHGKARILVNCAGIGPPAKVIDRDGNSFPLAQFSAIVNVNLIGAFNVLSKFAAALHKADPIGEERGVIINTASVAAFDGQIGQAAYSAPKSGIVGMTLAIARETARYGIRVMTIVPGLFLTLLLATLPQEAQDSLGRQVSFPPRLGDPKEFAQMVESIITNPMLNGETIRLDGAIRMAPK